MECACGNDAGKYKRCPSCRKTAREQVYKSRKKLRENGGMRERERLIREYYAKIGIRF